MYEITAKRDFTLEETPDHVTTKVAEGETVGLTEAEVAKHVAAGDIDAPEGFEMPAEPASQEDVPDQDKDQVVPTPPVLPEGAIPEPASNPEGTEQAAQVPSEAVEAPQITPGSHDGSEAPAPAPEAPVAPEEEKG